MPVKFTENDIISSQEDKRQYRALILENDLKVMLISDPITDMSGAALDIHVGTLSDPWELPGLAHFCEHMLFMGTEKYPEENDYQKYLSEHSGSSNAYTACDHTNFYFDVAPEHFEGAIDRFSQFFITPLFAESSVDREVNAVHSEHEKNVQNDSRRLFRLDKATSKASHDYSKFSTGNKETLCDTPKAKGIEVRDELLKFHKQFYSANIMGLSVFGKESLDELEAMVVDRFSQVENTNVSVPSWPEHPFGEEQCAKMVYVEPVKDIRQLNITFPIDDLSQHYKTSPGQYLGHLLGHEGPGSLLSCLKNRGWTNSIVAGQKLGAKGFSFFIVNVDLTEEGVKNVDSLVKTIFQYISFLRCIGPQQWVFDECRDIRAITYRFKDKEAPRNYVSSVAESLHTYPLRETLSGDYLLTKYDPEVISSVLNCLTADRIRVTLLSKAVADRTTQVERWYGTKYAIEDIDASKLADWDNCGENCDLQLPPKNEFIPSCFALHTPPEGEEISNVPELLISNDLCRVWYKLDDEFKLPKAITCCELFSPLAYLDPQKAGLMHLFVMLFRDALTEYSYAADLAGLSYSLHNTKYGLQLYISGYSDKQEVLLEKVVEKLTLFKVEQDRFDIYKEEYVRALRNFFCDQPHQHIFYYTSLLLSEIGWSKEEMLECQDDLTAENLRLFLPEFLRRLHIEMMIHGNLSAQRATAMVHTLTDRLTNGVGTKALLQSQLRRQRELQLPDGCHLSFQTENCVHKSSATELFLQFGAMSVHDNVLAEMLEQIFSEPAFDELRTKEQLGYIVWCGLRRANGVQGLKLVVQGDKDPHYLDQRIEAFLFKMKNHLHDMSESEFVRHRSALTQRRLERPKKMSHLALQWWSEVASHQYMFDRDRIEAQHLQSVTKEQVVQFYDRYVSADSDMRKKLCVRVLSTAEGGAGHAQTLAEAQTNGEDKQTNDVTPPPTCLRQCESISSISQFKSSSPLFPLAKPHISIMLEPKAKL